MPDIVNFTLLGSSHFFVFLKTFLSFITNVKLPGNSLIFWGHASMNAQCIPHYWGKTNLSTAPNAPQIMRLFQSGHWEQAPFPILRERKALFLPLASESFLICTLQNTPGKPSADVRDSLYAAFFTLIFYLETLAALLSLNPPPCHLLNSDSSLVST